jgi:hypothetical protein
MRTSAMATNLCRKVTATSIGIPWVGSSTSSSFWKKNVWQVSNFINLKMLSSSMFWGFYNVPTKVNNVIYLLHTSYFTYSLKVLSKWFISKKKQKKIICKQLKIVSFKIFLLFLPTKKKPFWDNKAEKIVKLLKQILSEKINRWKKITKLKLETN